MTAALAPPADDEWLLFDDAAAELGVSRWTLLRYARAGKVLRLYHAGRLYTTRASLEAYKRSVAQKAEARRLSIEKRSSSGRKRA